MFNPRGIYRYSFGRAGGGPGEFRNMGWSTHSGDTAFVFDASLRRITSIWLGESPRMIATVLVTAETDREPNITGRLGDGRWLVRSLDRPNVNARGFQRALGFIGVMNASATGSIRWVAELPDMAMFVYNTQPTQVDIGVAAFAPSLTMAVTGNTIWICDTAGDSLLMIDGASNARRAIKLPDSPMPLDNAMIDAARTRDLASARNQGERGAALARYEKANLPARMPAFEDLLSGPDGQVWVERVTADRAPVRYLVLSARGVPVGAVETIAGFRVTDIGRDYILGIHRDEDGVETVRMYSLTRQDDGRDRR